MTFLLIFKVQEKKLMYYKVPIEKFRDLRATWWNLSTLPAKLNIKDYNDPAPYAVP